MAPATMAVPAGADVQARQVTIDDAVMAIVDEQGCSPEVARATAVWVKTEIVPELECIGSYHPSTSEMAGPAYRLFHKLIPHDGPPTAAGEVLIGYALGPSLGELTLTHDSHALDNELKYCVVCIELRRK